MIDISILYIKLDLCNIQRFCYLKAYQHQQEAMYKVFYEQDQLNET